MPERTTEILMRRAYARIEGMTLRKRILGEPAPDQNETSTIANTLQLEIASVPRGTLRFWGDWFGRPYDNIHTLSACEVDYGILRLRFGMVAKESFSRPENLSHCLLLIECDGNGLNMARRKSR